MGNNQSIFTGAAATEVYSLAQTISISTRNGEAKYFSLQIVAVPLGARDEGRDETQTDGQWLFWLIALIYVVLVFIIYWGVYLSLEAFSALVSEVGY
jgi:hypothetical protein